MKHAKLFALLLLVVLPACNRRHTLTDNDWPRFQCDNYRSAFSPMKIVAEILKYTKHLKVFCIVLGLEENASLTALGTGTINAPRT